MGRKGQALYKEMGIIPNPGLENLSKHNYKGGEYTPLDLICYKYWWDPALSLIPLRMAPNLITILGFVFAFSNIVVILHINPSLDRASPAIYQLWGSVSFLFYMMMDAIDGRQARRTKSGSPLGQLLDHGCDSILSGVIAIVLASTLRIGIGVELVVLIAVSQIVFFIGQWEENYTGICRTCVLGLFGTTEYLLGFCILQISVIFFVDISLIRSLVCIGTVVVGLASSLYCITNVLVNTHRISTLIPLLPIVLLNVLFGFLVSSTHVTSFVPFLSLTLLNSLLVIQMILSTVTNLPINVVNQTLTILPLLCLIPCASENLLLIHTASVALYVSQYIVRAVLQISHYLNIKLMVIQFLVVLVSWRLIVRPLLDKLPFIESVSCGDSVSGMVGFTRPHTIKGTCLATVSGYILMAMYTGRQALGSLGTILSSGILANVFIVGINQLVDVEIDRVNGKKLPIAIGQLSWTTGRDIVGFCLIGAVTVAYYESAFWGHVVSGMCLIGFLYSVPPIRLKRFAIPAALCIVLARGVLGTVGGALAYAKAMEYELDDFAIGHLQNFTTIMVVFTCVIALMKDVPDVEGDIAENVRSLSVILGPGRVSDICRGLIYGVYAWTIIGARSTTACGFMHLYGLAWLWGRTVKRHKSVDESYSSVKSIEMHNYLNVIWPLFYYEFIAYLAPVCLEIFSIDVPMYVFSLILGLECGYVIMNEPVMVESIPNHRLGEVIQMKSGLDIVSLHKNLGLKGTNPLMHPSAQNDDLVTEAAVVMTVALSMHSKLTRLTGKSYANAKKLAILCGDWLLSKAVVALADTKSQQAIGEMGRSIATATCVDSDEQIADVIMLHANIAKQSS